MTIRDDLYSAIRQEVAYGTTEAVGVAATNAITDAVLVFFGNLDPDAPTDLIAAHLRADLSDSVLMLRRILGFPHRVQYLRDDEFRRGVDTLAGWLPLWVDAMAEDCEATDEARRQLAEFDARHDTIDRTLRDVGLIDGP